MYVIKKVIKVKVREFLVIVKEGKDGTFTASVPDLPGCITQADTKEELEKNIKEVIELYLEEEPEMIDSNLVKSIGIEKFTVEI
jgi:predicted RNase H-like HicB family nuclease